MDLALDVGISSKHLSFVETGKSRPSRKLILRIAQALKLPLRHQNNFLKVAGYSSEYSEEPFDGQKMEMIRQALQRMIDQHNPYPAFVVNTTYNILMKNTGFDLMVSFFLGEEGLKVADHAFRLVFAENGLWRYIDNWPAVRQFMTNRLWEEAAATQNEELISLYREISQQHQDSAMEIQVDNDLPILSLTMEKDAIRGSFFTTITTLGTPLDLTTQELRIESLFPADEKTKQLFSALME